MLGQFANFALNSSGSASITNSIVAGGATTTCGLATVTSGGHNISDDDTCGFTGTGDLENQDPELGALADNGGATPTHLPSADSVAIDSGGDCPSDDQRGEPRPADGDDDGNEVCDRGAVEVQPAVVTPPTSPPAGSPAAPTEAEPSFTG